MKTADCAIVGLSLYSAYIFNKLIGSRLDGILSNYFTILITFGPIVYKHRDTKLTNTHQGNQPHNEWTISSLLSVLFVPSMFFLCFRREDLPIPYFVSNFLHGQTLFLFTVLSCESCRWQPQLHHQPQPHHQSHLLNLETNYRQFASSR